MHSKQIAEKHSMDIPHVAAVELPLLVKNNDKAISMIGGKEKISKIINSSNRSNNPTSYNSNENILELGLRSDPFHHPIQSSLNTTEKVLLKVSIPRQSIPQDYYDNPSKYTIRRLLEINDQKNGPKHKTQPVAIINKTYSFKAMADFQVSTKNNSVVQDFNNSALNTKNYDTLSKYFEEHEKFIGISDYKKTENYQNNDHQLPPPPVLSPIRFPFDYRYQKNPLTTMIKDSESGEVKVISKKSTIKLHTIIIDFNSETPEQAAPPLIENLKTLTKKTFPENSLEYNLLECIKWLRMIFDIKPIWLRKHLEDIVPSELKRVIKQALPYVSFIYKSGPWRFCNVKFGVNPKSDKLFWVYQSEYFRIPGLHFNVDSSRKPKKIVPNTIKLSKAYKEIGISEYLLFDGVRLPLTVTYQVGDVLDKDILNVIQQNQEKFGDSFYRDVPEFQDGWINKQTMETIRRIIRYKLGRIVKETPIDPIKIEKIIKTDYTENDDAMEVDQPANELSEGEDVEGDVAENEEDEDDENEHEEEEETGEDQPIDDKNIMNRLKSLDDAISKSLNGLIGFIKQDSLEND